MEVEFSKAKSYEFKELIQVANNAFTQEWETTDFPSLLPKLYKEGCDTSEYHYIAKENGKIKAIVGCFPMEMQVLNQKLKFTGIGTVCVDPSARGKNYMKELMLRALKDMQEEGIDFSFLSGYRQRYEYFSYEPCGQQLNFYINSANMKHYDYKKGKKVEIAFKLIEDENSEFIEKIYKLHSKKSVRIIRNKEKILDTARSWSNEVLVLFLKGEFIGYLCCSKDKKNISEIELEEESFLLEVISSYLKSYGVNAVNLELPPYEKKKVLMLQQVCDNCAIENVGNFSVLNYEKVLKTLLELKSSYSKLAEGKFILNIKEYGTIKITVENTYINVKKTTENYDLSLNHLKAMEFLFSPLRAFCDFNEEVEVSINSWFPLPLFVDSQDKV